MTGQTQRAAQDARPSGEQSVLDDLLIALGFLTVVPVPSGVWERARLPGRSFAWFPLVGLGLGLISGAAAFGLGVVFPAGVAAALLVALGVFLTGGLHLDGLMDSCDGLFCAKPAAERLEVMKDSRVGAFGVLGALSLLLVKLAAFSALLEAGAPVLAAALVLAVVLGRWVMVPAVVLFPYGGNHFSLSDWFVRGAGHRQLAGASVGAALVLAMVALALASVAPVAALAAAILVALAVIRFALSRLPGLTGDVYGALGEVVEVVVLISFAGWYL